MFRTHPSVTEPSRRTFDNVRRTLEPTLYALRYERQFESGPAVVHAGTVYPIPYYFDPETNAKKKAWHIGNLVIDHTTLGAVRTVTVVVGVIAEGGTNVNISTMVCPLGGVVGAPYILKRFEDELIDVDLTPYDAIGCGYELDSGTVEEFHFATTLIWRPKLM